MSIIHRDYLPERKEPAFPRELAAGITRRAAAGLPSEAQPLCPGCRGRMGGVS